MSAGTVADAFSVANGHGNGNVEATTPVGQPPLHEIFGQGVYSAVTDPTISRKAENENPA